MKAALKHSGRAQSAFCQRWGIERADVLDGKLTSATKPQRLAAFFCERSPQGAPRGHTLPDQWLGELAQTPQLHPQ